MAQDTRAVAITQLGQEKVEDVANGFLKSIS